MADIVLEDLLVNQIHYEAVADTTNRPIRIYELKDSRQTTTDLSQLHFLIDGTANEQEARKHAEDALNSWQLMAFDGKPLSSTQISPQVIDCPPGPTEEDGAAPDGPSSTGRWLFVAIYSRSAFAPIALLDPVYQAALKSMEMDLAGENRRVYEGIEVVGDQYYTANGASQEKVGPILNVKRSGGALTIQGSDRPFPKKNFAISVTKPVSLTSNAWFQRLDAMFAHTNSQALTFTVNKGTDNARTLTYHVGELLFLGYTARIVEGASHIPMTFRFWQAFNQDNVVIGKGTDDQITIGLVHGHDEVVVERGEKAGINRPIPAAIQAYVVRHFEEDPFVDLHIFDQTGD